MSIWHKGAAKWSHLKILKEQIVKLNDEKIIPHSIQEFNSRDVLESREWEPSSTNINKDLLVGFVVRKVATVVAQKLEQYFSIQVGQSYGFNSVFSSRLLPSLRVCE